MGITDKIQEFRNWLGFGQTYPYYPAPYEVFTTGEPIPFVSPSTALHFTPVYRAVSLISNDIGRTEAEFVNPNLQRLYDTPNRFQSGYDFRRSLTMQALLYGNAFALINRRRNGEVFELLPLKIGSVTLDVSGKEPVYISTDYGKLATSDVLHIKASLLEGIWSLSPVNLCKTALTIGIGQENTMMGEIKNGNTSKMAIVHPSQINQAARQAIVADYMKNHAGPNNAGKPIVLAENVRVEKISSTANGSEIEVARRYSVQDVSRIYGVPMSYLSETAGSVYGSMEWLSRMYLDSCLSHWFASWSSEYFLKMNEEPMFDTDYLVRPPISEQFASLRTGIEAGIITRNEARAILDYEPVEGGDEFLTALNLGQGGGQTNIGTDTSGGVAQGDIV